MTKGAGVIDPGPAGRLTFLHSPGAKELIASIIFFKGRLLLGDRWSVDLVEANRQMAHTTELQRQRRS